MKSNISRLAFLALFCLPGTPLFSADSQLPLGEVVENVQCAHEPERTYAIYLPPQYNPEQKWPLLMLFEPAARASLPLKRFAKAADRYGFILACSYETQNYQAWETNWQYTLAMWKDLLAKHSIDPANMYAGGFSGGARLASRIAMFTQKIAGVIECGAGFWNRVDDDMNLGFDVISTIGHQDMNFIEILDLEQDLTKAGIPNRRLMFQGGHQWPPEDVAVDAVGWLYTRAHYRNPQFGQKSLVEGHLRDRLAMARKLEAEGDFSRAYAEYKSLLNDGLQRAGSENIQYKLKQMDDDPSVSQLRKQSKAAEKEERKNRATVIKRLSMGEGLGERDRVAMRKQMAWWNKEIQRLQKAYNSAESQAQKDGIYRIFDFLARVNAEKSVYAFREKDYLRAVFLNEVAGLIIPKQPYAFFNLAKAYAQLGNTQKALDALDVFLNAGGRRRALGNEPLLAPLKDHARFSEMLKAGNLNP